MSDKTKNVLVTFIFFLMLILLFILNLFKEDTEISYLERRKLAKFTKPTVDTIFDGSFSESFDKYVTDQILYREEFRNFKSIIETNLFNKKDNNGIYMYNNSLIKIEYPLNEKSVINASNKINDIKNTYLKNMKCYYSIVPDKNYFTDSKEYICLDYEKMQDIMKQNITNMQYIDIFDCLELEDYYITDIHWKQENLQKVVDKISTEMNFKNDLKTDYITQSLIDFEGIYAGQLVVETKKDSICVLTNKIIEDAVVYNYENRKESKIYDINKFNSKDKYDIYLSGSTPLITIDNINSNTEKELIVFRDSFASSLVPLFTEAYSKITLVDIRYMRTEDLGKYINFDNQDILFLYSTILLNNSSVLR